MKRRLNIFFLLVGFLFAAAPKGFCAEPLDSLVANALSAKLDEYVASMESEPIVLQNAEVDYIIGACTDSLVRQFTAIRLFDKYIDTKVMGLEAVAVHIFDTWFEPGTVRFENPSDEFLARMNVGFNRKTLLGETAPHADLLDPDGNVVSIPVAGKPNVLYFYSTDCAKCKLESYSVSKLLASGKYEVNFIAVNLKSDPKDWYEYRTARLDAGDVETIHLWDPENESDIAADYGLVSTPRLFLTDSEGVIIGRMLDSEALEKLLDNLFGYGDREAYKQTVKDLLFELSSDRTEDGVAACRHLIDEYITKAPEIWTSPEDSLEVLGLADMLSELYSRAEVGSKVPAIKVYGSKYRVNKFGKSIVRTGKKRLSSFRGHETLILFHVDGCPICAEQISKASKLLGENPKLRLIEVSIEANEKELKPDDFNSMMDSFDLASLPHLVLLSEKGVILRKYFFL